jgi:hypothetical protein
VEAIGAIFSAVRKSVAFCQHWLFPTGTPREEEEVIESGQLLAYRKFGFDAIKVLKLHGIVVN